MPKINRNRSSCPLAAAPFSRVFDAFYFKRDGFVATFHDRSEFLGGPSFRLQEELLRMRGSGAVRKSTQSIEPEWRTGHLHGEKDPRLSYLKGYPVHLHTDLDAPGGPLHLDFYGIAYYGPLSGLSELRVSRGGELIGRGGRGGIPPASFARNLPLAVQVEDGVLVLGRPEYDPSTTELHVEMELWRPVPGSNGRGNVEPG